MHFADQEILEVDGHPGGDKAPVRARAPESPEIAAMCQAYGAPEIKHFVHIDRSKCVLCGLCVKACTELSVGAISTAMRGAEKEVMPPKRAARSRQTSVRTAARRSWRYPCVMSTAMHNGGLFKGGGRAFF